MSIPAAPPDGSTVLETDRLLLRRWLVVDAAMQRQLWTERDPRVPPHRRVTADGRPSVEDLEDWIRRDDPSPSLGLLVAVRKDTGEAIGYCGLVANVHGPDDEPELAYEFLRSEWGQGLATEAGQGIIGWAESLGHTRLWATVRDWNAPSRRVMAKLGFVQTSRTEPDARHGDSLFYVKDLVATE
ncbi:GNAT family N-acetyltransferase [Microbacterium sp. MC2]